MGLLSSLAWVSLLYYFTNCYKVLLAVLYLQYHPHAYTYFYSFIKIANNTTDLCIYAGGQEEPVTHHLKMQFHIFKLVHITPT